MAGYIMTINDLESLKECVINGTYSTILKEPKNHKWGTPQEGTFADYLSMKTGDSIFFFHKRKIYGIGKIVNVGDDCKYLNYQEADVPEDITEDEYNKKKPLLFLGTKDNRCFCTFIPDPYFFENGIDMDDALSSNPEKFNIFRTMWKVSFIKIDEEECKALQDIILKRNEENLINGRHVFAFDRNQHEKIEHRINYRYRMNSYQLLYQAHINKRIKHEMAIEAALCDILGKDNETPFGKWDYVSHQVAASPFKPIDYMDKMDIFGYRYITGFKTISKYLVIEIKKDEATVDVIEQIMKYVDWINQEYSHGDYSMIEAFVVAADFHESVINEKSNKCIRNYTRGYRPTQTCIWNNVRLIRYCYEQNKLNFYEI